MHINFKNNNNVCFFLGTGEDREIKKLKVIKKKIQYFFFFLSFLIFSLLTNIDMKIFKYDFPLNCMSFFEFFF